MPEGRPAGVASGWRKSEGLEAPVEPVGPGAQADDPRPQGQGEGGSVGVTARAVSPPEPLLPAETGRGGAAVEGEDLRTESKVLEGKSLREGSRMARQGRGPRNSRS